MYSIEAISATLDSYHEAAALAFALFPKLDVDGGCGGLSCVVNTRFSSPSRENVEHAEGLWTSHESLLEYGQPKMVSPQWSMWGYSFFKVHAWMRFPFSAYAMENGEPKPRCTYYIDVRYAQRSWGLKDWYEKHDEILAFFDDAPESVRAEYRTAVAKADAEIARWTDARQKLAAFAIPNS